MDRPAVTETHISVLIFLGDRVYKVRKPVTTPFLDFSSREARREDCLREVALNSRLSPDVYLGVLDVVDQQGAPVDHLVVMRRLPEDRRLAAMIGVAGFDPVHVIGIARQVASFHARADRAPQIDRAGSVEHLTVLWWSNLEETRPFTGQLLDRDLHDQLGLSAMAYLDGRHALFAHRQAEGRIVDGHGDLLADDIFCLDDGPRILDCVEFDPRFRWGDVLYDTSFLAMDLAHRGRPDLARLFLDSYREFSGETHPTSLEDWYIAYRALVRAKIACLRAQDGDQAAPAEARAFLAQALRHATLATVHLVTLGGLPGTGKTTVAETLADRLGWTILRSDAVRRELAGLGPDEHAPTAPFDGIYAPGFSEAVYTELMQRARVALSMGESVILDATWLDPEQRARARRLASSTGAQLHDLCCVLPVEEAAGRIAARAAAGGDLSDATPEVLAELARRAEVPWSGALRVDTLGGPDRAVTQTLAHVGRDPQGSPR